MHQAGRQDALGDEVLADDAVLAVEQDADEALLFRCPFAI